MARKKSVKRKKKSPRKKTTSAKDKKVEKMLVENFVSLQEVITNLSIKFDGLSNQLSQLLDLFETSAKTLAKKDFNLEKENQETKEILGKIDNLFEQNKVIARGLTALHENEAPSQDMPSINLGISKMQPKAHVNKEQFQESISTKPQKPKFPALPKR
jgi:hypothetical protein